MRIRNSQAGVGHIAAVLVIVVVAVIGFAGYTVYKAGQDKQVATDTAQTNTAIKTKADLNNAGKLLDNTATQLDNDLNTSVLDGDIDQLL